MTNRDGKGGKLLLLNSDILVPFHFPLFFLFFFSFPVISWCIMKRCVVRGHESETIQPFKVDFLVRSHREEEKKALVFSYIFYSFLWLRDCVSMPILSVEYLSGICFENVSTLFGCWRVRCSVRPKAQVLLEEEEETRRTTYSLDYWQMCRHFLLTNWHPST